jgi:hypothetical protein
MRSRGIKSCKWQAQWLGNVCRQMIADNLTWCQLEQHFGLSGGRFSICASQST